MSVYLYGLCGHILKPGQKAYVDPAFLSRMVSSLNFVISLSHFAPPINTHLSRRCGPCKQFTPDLVSFYDKMNARRGKQNEFEIVWISRCRTVDDFGQYFTQMNWLALPPDEAMGQRGQLLGDKFKVKSIPTLVLLDEIGNVITLDGRGKIPMDKAGIGFPWRSPLSVLVSTLVPRSLRLLVKSQFAQVVDLVKGVVLGKGNKLKEALMSAGQK